MTKPKNKRHQLLKGTAKPVEAVVGDKRHVAGLVSIENNGQDGRGRVMGANGINWRLA
jgi:hypothetical protein